MKQTRLAAIADELIKLANLVKLADLEENLTSTWQKANKNLELFTQRAKGFLDRFVEEGDNKEKKELKDFISKMTNGEVKIEI